MDITLYWLTQDLRLDDNPALISAARSDVLLCVHCVDSRWFHPHRYHVSSMGPHRWQFLQQSLDELENALAARNQRLLREYGVPEQVLAQLVRKHHVTRVVCSRQVGSDELAVLTYLRGLFPALKIEQYDSNTLFGRDQLPPSLDFLAEDFAPFQRVASQQLPLAPIQAPDSLPPPALQLVKPRREPPEAPPPPPITPLFHGGEHAAQRHLNAWLARSGTGRRHASVSGSSTPPTDSGSTLSAQNAQPTFSPWLSRGCLSARRLLTKVQSEAPHSSTSTIDDVYQGLLQREYRYWLALYMGKQLFRARGLAEKAPLAGSVHPERYQKWCHGTTPWPLINACMRQLRETGYLSPLARQIVADCFVHQLDLDWRYGAAWFEHLLVDYDVANNWTHWQDIARVGTANRPQQPFDIDKTSRRYDATGEYRRHWAPDSAEGPLDSVDAADWPITR